MLNLKLPKFNIFNNVKDNHQYNKYLRHFSENLQPKITENPQVVKKREDRKKFVRKELFQESTKHLPTFDQTIKEKTSFYPLRRETIETGGITTLQINIGKRCNLTCRHCHVESGPTRTENMEKKTADRLVELMKNSTNVKTIDLTGGAPELNPHFKYIITEARKLGKEVIDRCNLTVFFEKGMNDIPQFLSENKVQVVASLPCYSLKNVDKQRGKGVFDSSVTALQLLNKLGYGKLNTGLELHLVFNPVGTALPGSQSKLEADYKKELKEHFDIDFNKLFTITNMPIKRFADDLYKLGEYEKYMNLLVSSFNKDTVKELMCRNLVNVSWDGVMYDCDFNQALEIELGGSRLTIWDIKSVDELNGKIIGTGMHCYGCTAGSGSSCSGSLS